MVWSPNGEAKYLITSLGLTHTSMRAGDIIIDGNKVIIVDNHSFREVGTIRER
jgi:hypothetical protein